VETATNLKKPCQKLSRIPRFWQSFNSLGIVLYTDQPFS